MSNDQQGFDTGSEQHPITSGPATTEPSAYPPPPYYGPPPATTDSLSIAAFVTALLGLGVIPIVLGVLGLRRTTEYGTAGRGFAIAGIVLGAVEVLVGVVLIALSLLAVIGGVALQATTGDSEGQSVVEPFTEPDATSEGPDGFAPLLDLAPLEVAGFSTAGFEPDFELIGLGALESYTASYTDGASVVDVVLTDWQSEQEGQAWAATQDAAFSADQLVDSGEVGEGVVYRTYRVGEVSTVVATNYTAALTLTGPHDAVVALYREYPL